MLAFNAHSKLSAIGTSRQGSWRLTDTLLAYQSFVPAEQAGRGRLNLELLSAEFHQISSHPKSQNMGKREYVRTLTRAAAITRLNRNGSNVSPQLLME